MKALAQRYPFPTNHHFIEKSMQVHKERIKGAQKCIDNEAPQYFCDGHERKSPTRKIMAKAAADDYLRRENFMLAQRIFKIMQGESEITAKVNHNDHLENHPGTMNFRQRLQEAQRVHHKNLMFAIRMQSIKPYYRAEDITIAKPLQHHAKPLPVGLHPPQGSKPKRRVRTTKKSKAIRAFERTLQQQQEDAMSIPNNDNNSPLGLYHGYVLGSRDEGEQEDEFLDPKRFRSVLLEYTKSQDNRLLDIVVLKEPFRDRYAIFGLDADDGQKYELRLTSEDVSSILDGDILVTSVEHVEVWMALLSKVKLRPVADFNQLPFSNEEMDVVSRNSRRRKRLEDMTPTDIDNNNNVNSSNKRELERPYFMPNIDNTHQQQQGAEVEEAKLYVTRKEKDDDLIKQVIDEPPVTLPVQQQAPPSRPSNSRQSSSKGVSPRPQLLSQQSKRANSSQEQEAQPVAAGVIPAFPSRPNSTRPSAPPSSQGSRGGRRVVIANNTNTTATKPAVVVGKEGCEVSQEKNISDDAKEKKQPATVTAVVSEKKVATEAAPPMKAKSVELKQASVESLPSKPIVAKKEEPVVSAPIVIAAAAPVDAAAPAPSVTEPKPAAAIAKVPSTAEVKAEVKAEVEPTLSKAAARTTSLTKIVDDVVTKALSQAIITMESRQQIANKATTSVVIDNKTASKVNNNDKKEVKTIPSNNDNNNNKITGKVSQQSSLSSVGSTTNKTATKKKSQDYSAGVSASSSIASSGGDAKKATPTNNSKQPSVVIAPTAIAVEDSIVEDLQVHSIEGSSSLQAAVSATPAVESNEVISEFLAEPQLVAREGSIETSGDGGSGSYEDDYEADFDSNA